jgi:hypothetical protein
VALVIDRAVPLSIPSAPLQVRNIEEGRCLV